MKEFTYDDISMILSLSKDILNKQCAIKNLSLMRKSLDNGCHYVSFTIGDRKFSVSAEEYPAIKALINACEEHLERDIKRRMGTLNYSFCQDVEEDKLQ